MKIYFEYPDGQTTEMSQTIEFPVPWRFVYVVNPSETLPTANGKAFYQAPLTEPSSPTPPVASGHPQDGRSSD